MADDVLDFIPEEEGQAAQIEFEPLDFQEESSEVPGALSTFGREAAQTGTMGFADEMAGALAAAKGKVTGSDEAVRDLYRAGKEDWLKTLEAGKEENPKAGYAGTAAGIAGSLLIPGAAGVKGMAALGGLAGLGGTDFEKQSALEVAGDVAFGTAAGAVGGKLLKKGLVPTLAVVGAGSQLPGALEEVSQGKYADAVGSVAMGTAAGAGAGWGLKKAGSTIANTQAFEMAKKRFGQGLQGLQKFGLKASKEVEAAQLAATEAQKLADEASKNYTKEAAQKLDLTSEKTFRILENARNEVGEQIGVFWDDVYKQNPTLGKTTVNPNKPVTGGDANVVDMVTGEPVAELGMFDKIRKWGKGEPGVPNPSGEVMAKLSSFIAEISPKGKIVPKAEITLDQLRTFRKAIQNSYKNKALAPETRGQLIELYGHVNNELKDVLTTAGLEAEREALEGLNSQFKTAVDLQGTIGKALSGAKTIEGELVPGGRFTSLSKAVGKDVTGSTERAIEGQVEKLGPKYKDAMAELKEASKGLAGAKEAPLPEVKAAEAAKGKAEALAEDLITPPRGMPGSLWEVKHSAVKAIPEYGANLAGLATKSVKEAVTSVPKYLYDSTPEAIQSLGTALVQKTGNKSLGDMLTKAATSPDRIRRNAILFMLMQNPDYRKDLGAHLGVAQEEEK